MILLPLQSPAPPTEGLLGKSQLYLWMNRVTFQPTPRQDPATSPPTTTMTTKTCGPLLDGSHPGSSPLAQIEFVENHLGIRGPLPIGGNLVDSGQGINLEMASTNIPTRRGRVKNNQLARGNRRLKILRKAIWIFLCELNVVLKILNFIIRPYGEERCIALSYKGKVRVVAPKENPCSIAHVQWSDPTPYLARSIVVSGCLKRHSVSMGICNSSYIEDSTPTGQKIPLQHDQRTATRVDEL